jgi:hypothetical protein
MALHDAFPTTTSESSTISLVPVADFTDLRVLAWNQDWLYASRGYSLLRAKIQSNVDAIEWQSVARYVPEWWRNLSVRSRPIFRLMRDGFHALATLSSGHFVGAVPGAIVSLAPGEKEFRLSHRVLRGTRPLHIASTPDDHLFWGEYFDNSNRDEVHVYASTDRGVHWDVAYTFPRGAVRHVHNIVYDEWANCLWVLTGDNGSECRILRVSCDFKTVDTVLSGHQQARAVALVPTPEGLYFSSDTPLDSNHVYRLDRGGNLAELAGLTSSSIFGCRAGGGIFFSTMVEPSQTNLDPSVRLYGSLAGNDWRSLMQWRKDFWPMSLFQYGNAILPDGRNTTEFLALTTIAVRGGDLKTSIWRVSPSAVL